MQRSKKIIPKQVKRFVKNNQFLYRQLTWQNRRLPDFVIIGAQKSGTTSLFHYISQHPQTISSIKKEVHYFDGGLDPCIDTFKKGEVWYRAHFPLFSDLSKDKKTFEASPLYIFNPLAPKRIYNLMPDVKIIAILRNPTERAISHYFHERRKGRETLPIMDAFVAEEYRLQPLIEKEDYKNSSFIHYSYKNRGKYFDQLCRYYSLFPRSNILIIDSNEFFNNTLETISNLFEFVGVNRNYKINNVDPRNVATNKNKIDRGVYKYLNEYFYNHNKALYALIGQDFEW